MQNTDGVQGAIVVTDPTNEDEMRLRDDYVAEAVLFLQDWWHKDGMKQRTGLDSEPFVWVDNLQSFLVNGKADRYEGCTNQNPVPEDCANDCSRYNYMSMVKVQGGETYRLRIIGGATLVGVNVMIGDHKMTVVEADGTLVQPFEVDNLEVMPG